MYSARFSITIRFFGCLLLPVVAPAFGVAADYAVAFAADSGFAESPLDSALLAEAALIDIPLILPDEPFDGGVTDTVFADCTLPAADSRPQVPASVTVVRLDSEPGLDLAEVLDRVAGLQMRRFGGQGARTAPSIRGSSGAQVVVMVDGIPLSDARDGAADLSTLPLDRYVQAEVYRGLAPTRFGGPGGAGAVNLVSRESGSDKSSLTVTAGSFGDVGGRIVHGWSGGPDDSAMLMLHGRRTDNRFDFRDHNQTFANPADDTVRQRVNAWFEEWGGQALGRTDCGGWRVNGAAGFFRRDAGRPGPVGGYESPHAVTRDVRTDGRFSIIEPSGNLSLDIAAARLDQRLHDELGEVGGTPPGTVHGVSDDLLLRAVWRGRAEAGDSGGLIWSQGADWRRQWYDESRSGLDDPQRRRSTFTGFATLQADLYGPRLSLMPGLRWQWLQDDFPPVAVLPYLPPPPYGGPVQRNDFMPSLGLVWEILPARLFCDAHVSGSVRAPSWTELFGDRRGVEGNSALLPERISTWDAAMRWRSRGQSRLRLGFFVTRIDDTIVYTQSSWRTSKAFNFGRVRTAGIEAEAAGSLPGGGGWTLALTWQDARDKGSDPAYAGKDLPYLTPLQGSLQLRQPLGSGWRAAVRISHEDANYRDRYNSEMEKAGSRTVLNFSLSRTWTGAAFAAGRNAVLTCELLNFTDDDVYDVEGYPLPGRSFRATMQLR